MIGFSVGTYGYYCSKGDACIFYLFLSMVGIARGCVQEKYIYWSSDSCGFSGEVTKCSESMEYQLGSVTGTGIDSSKKTRTKTSQNNRKETELLRNGVGITSGPIKAEIQLGCIRPIQ